jgi:hypothetical protein
MPRAICFVIMPYGTKDTLARPGTGAPARINFDHLWSAALQPAIEALGYDAVRADFDLGGMIIQEMLQRLALCDLVIADISISNVNVYYEIGIRHAAAAHGSVLIAADWADVPFDLNQIRQLRYAMPTEEIDEQSAAAMSQLFKDRVPGLASGESPFHTAVPGFPDKPDLRRMTAFREQLSDLAAFQAAIRVARTLPAAEARARALELRDENRKVTQLQDAVAIETMYLLRDCTDWKTTLEFIDGLPPQILELALVQEQRAFAQSQDGDSLHAIAALEHLISIRGDTSERRGLLGGRYKRLWRSAEDPVQKARYLDNAIKNYELGMHLDLNDYYPSCNLPGLYRARKKRGDDERAAVAASVTEVSCERARRRGSTDPWLKPTLLVAAFYAGDAEKAADLADEVRADGPAVWQLQTVLPDLEQAIAMAPDERAEELRAMLDDLRSLAEVVAR